MAGQKQGARGRGATSGGSARASKSTGSASGRTAASRGTGNQAAGGGKAAASRTNGTRTTGGRATGSKTADRRGPGSHAGGSQAGGSRAAGATAVVNGASGARPTAAIPAASRPDPAWAARLPWLFALVRPFRSMSGLQLATLILSLCGLGVSIYLTIAHFDTKVALICSDKGLVNCEEVTTSPTSMVFGTIPVAVLGLAFYVFMTIVNSPLGWHWQAGSRRRGWSGAVQSAIPWVRLGSLIVGMIFVLYLIYAELIDIGAICLWCTSVHVLTFLLFCLVVFDACFSWGRTDTGRQY
jgi:uncharacterized membrane protein